MLWCGSFFFDTENKVENFNSTALYCIVIRIKSPIVSFLKHFMFPLLLSIVSASFFSLCGILLFFGMRPITHPEIPMGMTRPRPGRVMAPFLLPGTGLIRGQVTQGRQEPFCRIWLLAPREGSFLSSFWITHIKDVCFRETLREGQPDNEARKQKQPREGRAQATESAAPDVWC